MKTKGDLAARLMCQRHSSLSEPDTELIERLEKFGLELNLEKTRLIAFGRLRRRSVRCHNQPIR